MNELGRNLAARNAWKDGFASTLAAMAGNEDWNPALPPNSELGRQRLLGRNAAITLIKGLGQEKGTAFLTRYEGFRGRDQALADLGGYKI